MRVKVTILDDGKEVATYIVAAENQSEAIQ
jgi:hypothetical protein